jgi:hypothetical protein
LDLNRAGLGVKEIMQKLSNLSQPSSTITAATLAGMAVALAWEIVATFTDVQLSPGIISASTVFASALVGYLKKENVLKVAE